jgi:hypothetical protein
VALAYADGTPAITATVRDGSVSLAKMANLATDQFIGRTAGTTGVPQTATITAAARTVLDDATVAAMVNTIGGAASTGSGGLVRATSPALVTPDLGTPSVLVATNATGTAPALNIGGNAATVTTNANLTGPVTSVGNATTITDDAITLAKLAPGTSGNLISYDAAGNPVAVGTGALGEVLTSNGPGLAPSMQPATGGGGAPSWSRNFLTMGG